MSRTWELLDQWLSGPLGSGVRDDLDKRDAAAVMARHEQDKQHLVGHGRHHKEIEGDQLLDLDAEEHLPRG
jgi:hypothetical protein